MEEYGTASNVKETSVSSVANQPMEECKEPGNIETIVENVEATPSTSFIKLPKKRRYIEDLTTSNLKRKGTYFS